MFRERIVATGKEIIFAHIILIIILGFLVYGNSLNGGFIRDDHELIENNTYLKHRSNIPKIFTENIGSGAGLRSRSYRPLQMLTYMLDHSLYRLNTTGYHLTNILLHTLTALSIYWLVTVLYGDRLLSFFTSALFVTHPVHSAIGAHIAGRADSLVALFMLLSLIFYIKQSHRENISKYYTLTLLSFAAALLSKEISIIFPVLLLLYHYTFKRKLDIVQFSPILGITLLYIGLRITVFGHFLSFLPPPSTLLQRIPGFFVAITNYLKILFLPFDLYVDYGNKLFSFTHPKAILGLLILFSSAVYAFKVKESDRLVFFSLCWFFICLLPSSNLYYINAYMAEHWLYLPSMGFFLILGKGLSRLYNIRRFRASILALTLCLIAFYSYLTVIQNRYWCEPIVFYNRILNSNPNNSGAYNGLGLSYQDTGKGKEAQNAFKKAIEIDPEDINGYINLALIYHDLGRDGDAISLLKKAIELNPAHPKGYNNLAVIYHDINRNEEAVALYNTALQLNPNYALAYYNLANLYHDLGEHEKAITLYKKAMYLNPDHPQTYYNLGLSYQDIDKIDEAITFYKKAIKIKPDYARAYSNLAVLYQKMGKKEEAINLCEKAIQLDADFAEAYYNLGNTYRYMGENEEAIASYKRATEIKDDFVEAHYNLGNTYLDINRSEDAITSYKRAIELKKDFLDAYYNIGNAYLGLKKNEEAIAAYKKAIELNPDNGMIYKNLATAYFFEEKYELSKENFDKAKKLGVTDSFLQESLKAYINEE